MKTYSFESLFYYLAREYYQYEFSKAELEQVGWPIPLPYLTASGLRAKSGNVYSVPDLISYARLHSIPQEGIYYRHTVRPSKILHKETGPDGKITMIHIAAGWLKPPQDARRGEYGQLVFLCPFCGNLHYHGAGEGGFGDGDGPRIPHCLDHENPAFMRRDIQPLTKRLAPSWQFHLTETADKGLLGDLPPAIKRRLGNAKGVAA